MHCNFYLFVLLVTMALYPELLCVIINLPEVICEYISQYLIEKYECRYSIPTSELFRNVLFNKQLGILYCASRNKYELIDYHNHEPYTSPYADILFSKTQLHNIIYSDENSVITVDVINITILVDFLTMDHVSAGRL